MRHIFSIFKQSLDKVLVSGLIVVLSVSALVLLPSQASLAESPTLRQPMQTEIGKFSQAETAREKAYDKEIEALNDPKGLDKEYEENLENYEETQPNKGLIKEAKSLIEKVSGQE